MPALVFPTQPSRSKRGGTYGERELLKMLSAALMLSVTSALPLRAPARGPRLSTCNKPWKGCPEGGSRLGLAGFSEALSLIHI